MMRSESIAQACMMIGAVFFCHSATAQVSSQSLIRKAISACGPAETRFAVTAAPGSFVVPVSNDQAKVYFIGHTVQGSSSGPVIRLGMDGRWVGAVRGSSYIAIPVMPARITFVSKFRDAAPTGISAAMLL